MILEIVHTMLQETCKTSECTLVVDVNVELNKALMKNPEVLAKIQDHVMTQSPADYIKS